LFPVVPTPQAVKPGIGGHFPSGKITDEIAAIRKRSKDQDIITPARYPDIYDSNSLRKKVKELREMSGNKPVGVKIAAGNIEKDLAVILEAEPDFITIDGRGGATGSVNKFIKDSASVPTIMALARVRDYLEQRGGTRHFPDHYRRLEDINRFRESHSHGSGRRCNRNSSFDGHWL